jgi:guanosine-3',5'-bis(diphosphate) 3'-pyrophosphohydrolase
MKLALKPSLKPALSAGPRALSNLVPFCADLAARAHLGQQRKVTGIPYIVHPYRVACLVQEYGGTEDQIAAAWCHDVLEDCPDFRQEAEANLPPGVLALVRELTKAEISPGVRVKGEAFLAELRRMSAPAAFIKIADRMDNLLDGIKCMPKEWLAKYLPESEQIYEILKARDGCQEIANLLFDLIGSAHHHLEN